MPQNIETKQTENRTPHLVKTIGKTTYLVTNGIYFSVSLVQLNKTMNIYENFRNNSAVPSCIVPGILVD